MYYTIEKYHNIWTVWCITNENEYLGIYTPIPKNTKKECKLWCKLNGIILNGKCKKSNSKKENRTKKEI